jgi:hypothetical protein
MIAFPGTTFVPQTFNSTEELYELALSLFSPSSSPTTLQDSVQTLLQLYPDIPALGWSICELHRCHSPFHRVSLRHWKCDFRSEQSVQACGGDGSALPFSNRFINSQILVVGDSDFQSQRRFWMDTAANAGVKTFGYLFTESEPTFPPALGGLFITSLASHHSHLLH